LRLGFCVAASKRNAERRCEWIALTAAQRLVKRLAEWLGLPVAIRLVAYDQLYVALAEP
jgi:hypothetical protein